MTWRWRSRLDSQKHDYGKWSTDLEVERATKIYSSKDLSIRGCEDELSFKRIKTVSPCRNRIKSQKKNKQRIKDILKHDLSMINRSEQLWFEAGNYATTVHAAHFYGFSQKLTSEVRCCQLPFTSPWEACGGCDPCEGGKEGGFLENAQNGFLIWTVSQVPRQIWFR